MAKTTWAIDPTHSEVGFKVKHLMFTNVSGKFNAFSASVESEDDDFSTAKSVLQLRQPAWTLATAIATTTSRVPTSSMPTIIRKSLLLAGR